MNKSERINTMMRFINNRARFSISELMEEFDISKSTALRDIREIERTGLPLTSEVGRDGGYSVLKNSVLPPVRFTNDEIKALFIALLSAKNQQLPYLRSRQSLTEKLIGLLSDTQKDDLILLGRLLLFKGSVPINPDILELNDIPHPMIDELILNILSNQDLRLTTNKNGVSQSYSVHIENLYNDYGTWMIDGYDLLSNKSITIDTRYLVKIEQITDKKTLSKLRTMMAKTQIKNNPNIELILGPDAIMQFRKYHPFKLMLSYTDPFQSTAKLSFFVETNSDEDLNDTANWILFLGNDMKIQTIPLKLREVLNKRFLSL